MGYELNSPVKLQSDNYRLRKRIEDFESGEAVLKLQKQHGIELRSRDFANKQLEREAERYRNLWLNSLREIDLLRDMLSVAENKADDTADDRDAGLGREMKLLNQLEERDGTITKLKIQMNHDYENSSIPSSQKPNHKKIKNSREKTGRRPGAQPGHVGHKKKQLVPTETIEIPVPARISENPDYYPTGHTVTKQKIDIEICIRVTRYATPEYRSRSTGRRIHAPFPDGVVNDVTYGGSVKAFAFLMNNYCNVSIDKTQNMMNEMTDGKIQLSKGMINGLSREFSANTQEERQKIYRDLLKAPVMYSDATSGRVNGKGTQVVICANKNEHLYFFREHKGHEGLKGTPVEEYQHILVHDHDKTYYNYGGGHQECLAHVLRYLQDSVENEPEPDYIWNRKMKELLTSMIHDRKQSDNKMNPDQISLYEKGYDEILVLAESEYRRKPPGKYYRDGFNLFKRMREYRDSHLLFLHHPEVEHTDNISERGLRKYKRKQHQAVTFRSNASVVYLCDSMSILETNRLQGKNIFTAAKMAFE